MVVLSVGQIAHYSLLSLFQNIEVWMTINPLYFIFQGSIHVLGCKAFACYCQDGVNASRWDMGGQVCTDPGVRQPSSLVPADFLSVDGPGFQGCWFCLLTCCHLVPGRVSGFLVKAAKAVQGLSLAFTFGLNLSPFFVIEAFFLSPPTLNYSISHK